MTQDHTSQEYLDMLTEVYFASNSALHPDDLKLVKVESQVAGGINYKFTFKVLYFSGFVFGLTAGYQEYMKLIILHYVNIE